MSIVLMILIATIIILIYNRFTNIFSYWRLKRVHFVQPLKVNNKLTDVLLSRIDLEDVFEMVYSELKGHKLGGFYKFLQPCLMVLSPDVIETILVTKFNCFHDNWSHVSHEADPLASRSPFFMTGDRWKEVRTHLDAAFTTNNIKAMFPFIVDVCKELQKHLEDIHCKDNLEINELSVKYITDVTSTCTFGIKGDSLMNPDSKIKKFREILLKVSVYMKIKFILALIFPNISFLFKIRLFSTKTYKLFADILKEVLSQRKINGTKQNDYLQFLLQIKDGLNFSSDVVFSCHETAGRIHSSNESDIIALAVSFFTESFEKSSAILSAMLLELASNEEIQETLIREIDTAMEQNNGVIGFEMIQGMKYLDMVLSESLRKWPVVTAMMKVCTRPCVLRSGTEGACTLEVGTPVVIPVFSIHRDPEHYPDPDKFDPERFSEEKCKKRARFSYLPFSAGPRGCLGVMFAVTQIKSAVVTILSHFKISTSKKTISTSTFNSMTNRDIWLVFEKRNASKLF